MAGSTNSIAHSFVTGDNPLSSALALFILQTIIIISFSRLIGQGLKYIHQPSVIAEVIGGILLGKSALSRIDVFRETIFPATSLSSLKLIADVGLVLFLFLVGLELDPIKMFRNVKQAVSVSLAGILVPFACGVGASKALYMYLMTEDDQKLSPFPSFLLFTGVAMSITAFPVLARILSERKLMQTTVGQLTISSAAVDDAIAWIMLLVVVAIINNTGNYLVALYVFLITVAWAAFLFVAIRPLFQKMVKKGATNETVSQLSVFFTFLLVLTSAWFTEAVGVHAIFGGFLAGLIIPHDHGFAIKLTEKVEDLVTILFLPLYFAYSGLNTRIDQLNSGTAWGMVFLVIAVACFGKIIGCFVTSRWVGLNNRESLAVGILMNTKGLVELIVLNLGLQAKVISVDVFTVMVIMALATTFMTVPLISWVYPPKYYASVTPQSALSYKSRLSLPGLSLDDSHFKVLLALPNMHSVRPMMSLMQLVSSTVNTIEMTALRLYALGDRMGALLRAQESTEALKSDPVLSMFKTFAQLNHIPIESMMAIAPSQDFADCVLSAAKENDIQLIVLSYRIDEQTYGQEASKEISQLLDDRKTLVHQVCDMAHCSVAIFIDRGFRLEENEQVMDMNMMTMRSFNSLKIKSAPVSVVSMYVVFVGGLDDCEAVLFALNFHKHVQVHLLHLMVQEQQDTVEIDLFASTDAKPDSLATDTRSTSSKNKDHQVIQRYLEEMEHSTNPLFPLTFEQVTVAQGFEYSRMLEWIQDKNPYKSDLIVMGKSLYNNGYKEDGPSHQQQASAKSVLEQVTPCSLCIIQSHVQND